MQDEIILGTGNSRYLKSAIPSGTTWEQALALLRDGTFPIDFNGKNNEGIAQAGTPLNKATLLKDATAISLGLPISALPDDAFRMGLHAAVDVVAIGRAGNIEGAEVIATCGAKFSATAVTDKNGKATVVIPDYGEWTITVSQNGAELGASKLLVDAARKYETLYPLGPTASTQPTAGTEYNDGFDGLTADVIGKIANAISDNSAITNETSEIWVSGVDRHISIGDTISYALNGTNYPFRVMGFNHYDLTDATAYGSSTSTGKAGILMQMVDSFDTTQQMKNNMTSSDGWHNSDLRTWMNGNMLGYFPSSAQSVIKQVNIDTARDISTATLATTSDKLFLPAEVEVFGTATYAKAGTSEGTRYAWYAANDTAANRVKKVNGSAAVWWERSPYLWAGNSSKSYFCLADLSGRTNNTYANVSCGVAPCFNY